MSWINNKKNCAVLDLATHKVHIYLEYHSVCPLRGSLHPALLQASVSPRNQKGGTHSPAGEGVGESQFGRLEKKPSILSTLCLLLSHREQHKEKGDNHCGCVSRQRLQNKFNLPFLSFFSMCWRDSVPLCE
jgi:hypothetical protein